MNWKPIDELDGLYLISDTGKVFSVRTNRIIKTHLSNMGYERVSVDINGETYKYSVHRLVATAFIPNPDNLPCVNHKDENPLNNNVDNLEWCTQKYNINYGTCIERRVKNTVHKKGADAPRAKEVYQFTLDGELVGKYGSLSDAVNETGLNKKSLGKACRGLLKTYSGYVWSYDGTFHYDDHKHYENRHGIVYCYDLQGNLIKEYNSPDEMRADGLNPANVGRVCRGERKTYNNYIFTRKADT